MQPADCPDLPADGDEDPVLPSAEAMLAGTLALMTGFAEHCEALAGSATPAAGTQGAARSLPHLLAAKAASNLFFLAEHPLLSAAFRSTLWRLRSHWQDLERRVAPPPPDPRGCAAAACPREGVAPAAAFLLAASTTRH